MDLDPQQKTNHQGIPAVPSEHSREEGPSYVQFDLVRILFPVVRSFNKIVATTLLCAFVAYGFAWTLKKTYTAQAVFMPPSAPEQASSAVSLFGKEDPTDTYEGLLGSRSVQDDVIDEAGLLQAFHVTSHEKARAALRTASKFTVEKDALIGVTVVTTDPQLSARIANAYLDALYKVNGEMSASSAEHRGSFLSRELDKERTALEEAEAQVKNTQEKTGVVLPQGEAQADLNEMTRLEASIQDAEARLSALLTNSSESNPEVIQARASINALRAHLYQLQGPDNGRAGLRSGKALPGILVEDLRNGRALREHEQLYESLFSQYEKAMIQASDPGPQLQIVDRAIVPETKSGPPRTLYGLLGGFFGAILSIMYALFGQTLAAAWKRAREMYRTAKIAP